MKKFLLILALIAMTFALVGCEEPEEVEAGSDTTTTTTTETTETTETTTSTSETTETTTETTELSTDTTAEEVVEITERPTPATTFQAPTPAQAEFPVVVPPVATQALTTTPPTVQVIVTQAPVTQYVSPQGATKVRMIETFCPKQTGGCGGGGVFYMASDDFNVMGERSCYTCFRDNYNGNNFEYDWKEASRRALLNIDITNPNLEFRDEIGNYWYYYG
jgi:hypothetical protein